MNNVQRITKNCEYLVASGLWPSEQDLRWRAWLHNFSTNEDKLAASKILERFIFVDRDFAFRALVAAYRNLLRTTTSHKLGYTSKEALRNLHETFVVCGVQGEDPKPTDSGYTYAKAARDKLGFQDSSIVSLDAAISHAKQGFPVILVDDFAGSGSQVSSTLTWVSDVHHDSLETVLRSGGSVFCLTAIMTSIAFDRLAAAYPRMACHSGFVVPPTDYSVRSLLPQSEHPEVHELLHRVATHLSVPSHVDPAYGYDHQGLLLGIHDSIPDLSLPLLWATGKSDWIPMVERTH